MKTERERFEDWFKEKYSYSAEYFEITKFDENMGFYTANDLYNPDSSIAAWVLRASFESWQAAKAQAVPEGFVVASTKGLNIIYDQINDWNTDWPLVFGLFNRILEAQDQAND